jgi:hypothetical protein
MRPECAGIYFLTSETYKMKQQFKRILLVQGIVLTTLGSFANDFHVLNGIDHLNKFNDTIDAKSAVIKTVLTESKVSFNAQYMSHAIDLNWNVSGGSTYQQFFIERSLDGINFEKAGEVKASKSNDAAQQYTFTDYVKPAVTRKNDIYYRLKQVDADANTTYSKVLILRMYNSKSVTAVSVTPDPAVNDILVNVQLKEKSFVVMTVKDNNGGQIMKKTAHAENGASSFSLDGTSKLQPGSYQLEVIINSNERLTMQLIKS